MVVSPALQYLRQYLTVNISPPLLWKNLIYFIISFSGCFSTSLSAEQNADYSQMKIEVYVHNWDAIIHCAHHFDVVPIFHYSWLLASILLYNNIHLEFKVFFRGALLFCLNYKFHWIYNILIRDYKCKKHCTVATVNKYSTIRSLNIYDAHKM